MSRLTRITALATAAASVMASGAAHAHHPMGGATPDTFATGLLSGLGHPIIGIDHLAFVIAIGIAAAFVARGALLPIVFVAATALGVFIHLQAVDLMFAELVIAGSVVLAGGLLALGVNLPRMAWAALFAVAGIFHGYAYGESIIGAETTPLAAYFLGFVLVQSAIAYGVMLITRTMLGDRLAEAVGARVAAGTMAGIGIAALVPQLMPF